LNNRERWVQLFRDPNVNFTRSSGSFVFFKTGIPHAEFAAALSKEGVIDRPRVSPVRSLGSDIDRPA
jgi:hypothetical protein